MKPTKNRYHCEQSNQIKMLFATQKEALRFLKFNADDIENETGKRPIRAYHCSSCGGWHVTSKSSPIKLAEKAKRSYGDEKGTEMYNSIVSVCGDKSISHGLQQKIKELGHNLKFERIDVDRCEKQIDTLLYTFEIIMKLKAESKEVINYHFKKFSKHCNTFIEQRKIEYAS